MHRLLIGSLSEKYSTRSFKRIFKMLVIPNDRAFSPRPGAKDTAEQGRAALKAFCFANRYPT